MYNKILTLLTIFLLPSLSVCFPQDNSDSLLVPWGLEPGEWGKVQTIWKRNSYPVTIRIKEDRLISGQIFQIDSNAISIWTETSAFPSPYIDQSQIIIFDKASVEDISAISGLADRLLTSSIFWGTAAGATASTVLFFIGGGWISPVLVLAPTIAGTAIGSIAGKKSLKGESEKIILDPESAKEMKKYVLFPSEPGISIDDKSYIPESLSGASFNDLMDVSPLIRGIFRIPRFSFTWQSGFCFPAYSSGNNLISGGFALRARLAERFTAGFQIKNLGSMNTGLADYSDSNSGLSFYENLSFSGYTVHFEYIPLAVSRFLTNRFEIAAGAGISVNKFNFTTSSYDISNGNILLTGEESVSYNTGFEISSGLDFYLMKRLSLNISLKKSFSKAAKPDNLTAESPVYHEVVTFETVSADPSSFDLVFGLRIHFL